LADLFIKALQLTFQKDEGNYKKKDEEKDEVVNKNNATNNNANYVARKNFSKNNYDHNDSFVEVTYINSLLEC
jgi:hypothetical protein